MQRGPIEFTEGRQAFCFSEDWYAAKYDNGAGHARLQRGVSSKAVDFCAVSADSNRSVLIEVKDFRGHGTENRERIKPETKALALEVAQKVRDSLAGVLGQVRVDGGGWRRLGRALANPDSELLIILWMELDSHARPAITIKPCLDAHAKVLKERLAWTGARVLVLSELVGGNILDGLRVSSRRP